MIEALHIIKGVSYNGRKPKGPVLENTISSAVATPTDKRGFVMPKFLALRVFALRHMVLGQMGLPARMVARLSSCFQHLPHPLRLKTHTVAFLSRSGAMSMTAITPKLGQSPVRTRIVHGLSLTDPRCAEVLNALPGLSDPAQPAAIPSDRVVHLLGAHNACGLASAYLEKGNFAAARRKLVQALASVNQLAGV